MHDDHSKSNQLAIRFNSFDEYVAHHQKVLQQEFPQFNVKAEGVSAEEAFNRSFDDVAPMGSNPYLRQLAIQAPGVTVHGLQIAIYTGEMFDSAGNEEAIYLYGIASFFHEPGHVKLMMLEDLDD